MRFVAKDGTALPDKNKEKGEASCRSASQSIAVMKDQGFKRSTVLIFKRGLVMLCRQKVMHVCLVVCPEKIEFKVRIQAWQAEELGGWHRLS